MKIETLIKELKVVQILAASHVVNGGATAPASGTTHISCKNLQKLFLVIMAGGTTNTDTVLTFQEAATVAGGSAATVTKLPRLWKNTDCSAADTFTEVTAANHIDISHAASANQIWVVEWDCAKFADGLDCFGLYMTSGSTNNFISVLGLGVQRYDGDVAVIGN